MLKPPEPSERLGTSVSGPDVLRATVGIAELGSIAAAVRAENISPWLASRRLASLEAAFDTTLFQRTTRRLQLTGAGQLVLALVRESLRHHAHLVDELGEQQHRLSGLLRIVCNEYTSIRYLLQAIAAMRQQHPALRFIITMSDEPIRLIEQGYDLVIHVGRLPDRHRQLGC